MLKEVLMISRKTSFIIGGLVLLISLGLPANSSRAQSSLSNKFESGRLPWRRLSYMASSVFGKVTTEIQLAELPAIEVAHLLIAASRGIVLQESGATIMIITVHSDIKPLFGSDEILKTQAWYDPKDGKALQRDRLFLGNEKWQKRYRFTDQGVFRLRNKPQDSREDELPPEQWTKVREEFYAYNHEGLNCAAVLEPSGLLYLVSANNFKLQEPPLSLCVFNKKQLHRLNVSLDGDRRIKVNYLENSGGNQTRREKEIDAAKVSFQPRAMVSEDQAPEEFSFLGLNGDFDIFIDKATQLPVQISGKILTFGKIDIKLQEVSYQSPTK
jgi:hypothetical protein